MTMIGIFPLWRAARINNHTCASRFQTRISHLQTGNALGPHPAGCQRMVQPPLDAVRPPSGGTAMVMRLPLADVDR